MRLAGLCGTAGLPESVLSLSLLWAVARAVRVSETPCCAWRDRSLEVSAVPLVTAALTDLL